MLRRLLGYSLLLLAITLSFWFSPAPRTAAEYCGTYLHLASFAGFTANCDGFVYMDNARYPGHLLAPQAVRQSRPLYILLGTAVGYPLAWAVRGLRAGGLLPVRLVQKLPAKYQPLLGFYLGYVLLNYLALLAALLLFRHLYYHLTAGQGSRWVLLGLLVFLLSNQVTKAFFWTAHQQMLTLLVPLVLLWTALKLRESARWRARLPALALLGGALALSYGSFVLGLPVVLYGLGLERQRLGMWHLLGAAVALAGLYALPTGLWVLLLKLRGVAYYNHEAEAYGQVVWLRAALRQPFPDFLRLAMGNVGRFLGTLSAVAPLLVAALVLVLLPARHPRPYRTSLPALGGLLLLLFVFLAGLGYYRERLTFALVPLLLLVVAVALAQWPARRWVPWVVGAAALGWHIGQVLSYGPFS